MHSIVAAALEANQTHPGAGRLLAACMLAVKARILIMPIAPHGCGKSTAGRALADTIPDSLYYDTLTRSALARLQETFTGFDGLIVIDDLGKGDSPYGRIATVTTMCELTYSHFVRKVSAREDIDVQGFSGAAIVCAQPVIIKQIMLADEWDAVILDKSIRYYHMYRPAVPNHDKLHLRHWSDIAIEDVAEPGQTLPGYATLVEIGLVQWGRGRVHEHWSKLLRACAALDGRTTVTAEDVAVCEWAMRPMYAERHLMRKRGLEAERDFDNDLLCFFVEWASHGAFTVQDLMEDYHISQSTAYTILNKYKRYWEPLGDHPTRFAPASMTLNGNTERTMYDVLAECGIEFSFTGGDNASSEDAAATALS